ASIPAAAAYAASALAAFPADGMATLEIPNSRHIEMAQESPRALNEAVGFNPSSFTHSASAPSAAPRRQVRISGVQPSPRETMLLSAAGRMGAYRHMLAVPLATERRGQRWRSVFRSYRTSSGPPHSQRFAGAPGSRV